jgi:hypothetical protein
MSEARTEDRLGRLEDDVREIKATLASLVPLIHRIDERLNTALPQLATKAELADSRAAVISGGSWRRWLGRKPSHWPPRHWSSRSSKRGSRRRHYPRRMRASSSLAASAQPRALS